MNITLPIGARQIKAARALLDWSQEDLARHTQLSIATIRKLELGYISPRYSTTQVLRQALEGAGLEFIESNGVRRRPEDITIFQGPSSSVHFIDDVHQTLRKRGGTLAIVATSEITLAQSCGSDDCQNLEHLMSQNESVAIKCILTEALVSPLSSPRFEFRFISKNYVETIPFFVYGDKFAIVVPGQEVLPKIIVVQSVSAAQTSRRQFTSLWDKATPFYAPSQAIAYSSRSRSS